MSTIACVGEALVDLLGEPDVTDLGASEYFHRAAGGAVSNVAIGVARLGGSVAFIGAVGRDPFGKFLVSTLAHENVDVDGVRSVDERTALIFVSREPAGGRDFLATAGPGAHSMLAVEDLDVTMLARAKAIHFGGFMLACEPGRSASLAAARAAAPNALVSFDPNVRPRSFRDRAEMREAILSGCQVAHLVKASSEDLESLGMSDDDPARLLRGATVAAVVTRGSGGCRWATRDGRSGDAEAPAVEAIDTTGAGDAFMAALLWRIVYHHDAVPSADALVDAVRYAVTAGALACVEEGAIAGLRRADELESAVRRTSEQSA